MSIYVAAYDIVDDRRRVRVSKVLLEYGRRVQKSVFELWLEPRQVKALRRRIGPILGVEDRFDLFPVDERGPRKRVGWQRAPDAFAAVRVFGTRDDGDHSPPAGKKFSRDDLPCCVVLERRIRYLGIRDSPKDQPVALLPAPVTVERRSQEPTAAFPPPSAGPEASP